MADISFPSTVNIGFDVSNVINQGIPVIAMYKKGEDPKFISPNYSSKMIKIEYTKDNLEEVLDWALNEIYLLINKRFTFFINPEIERFLNKVSKQKRISKSLYIRSLIKNEMLKDE